MKNKKGVTLIEVVVSLAVLSLSLTLFASCLKMYYLSRMMRREKDEINRIIYSIEEEIKFNYSYGEIINKLASEVKLKKYNGFLKDLAANDLFTMEAGQDILIKKENEAGNDKLFIKIEVKSEKNDLKVKEEKIFIKDKHMYEDYEK